MNSFEGYSHPGISFIGSFIHSFIFSFFFFSLSQQLEKSSETAFDLSALDPPRLLLPSPSPRRARAILHSFDERGATPAHPLPIQVSQLPRRRHARCDRCALKLVSQLAYHDLDSIAHENESFFPIGLPFFHSAFLLCRACKGLKEGREQVRLRTEEFSNFSKSFLIFTRSMSFVRIYPSCYTKQY